MLEFIGIFIIIGIMVLCLVLVVFDKSDNPEDMANKIVDECCSGFFTEEE